MYYSPQIKINNRKNAEIKPVNLRNHGKTIPGKTS